MEGKVLWIVACRHLAVFPVVEDEMSCGVCEYKVFYKGKIGVEILSFFDDCDLCDFLNALEDGEPYNIDDCPRPVVDVVTWEKVMEWFETGDSDFIELLRDIKKSGAVCDEKVEKHFKLLDD